MPVPPQQKEDVNQIANPNEEEHGHAHWMLHPQIPQRPKTSAVIDV